MTRESIPSLSCCQHCMTFSHKAILSQPALPADKWLWPMCHLTRDEKQKRNRKSREFLWNFHSHHVMFYWGYNKSFKFSTFPYLKKLNHSTVNFKIFTICVCHFSQAMQSESLFPYMHACICYRLKQPPNQPVISWPLFKLAVTSALRPDNKEELLFLELLFHAHSLPFHSASCRDS